MKAISIKMLTLCVVGFNIMLAQLQPWPDAVAFYLQGPNATPGYDSTNPYFPQNVLGRPDSTATGISPAFSPLELQALGTGGEIILQYVGRAIVNGPGPDFTVFENPFYVGGDTNNVFREVGIISVSRDGTNYTQFPFSGTPVWNNLAGATPTLGGNPLDSSVSGGDQFDLGEVGIDSVHYVKIVDAAGFALDDGPSFDLDAVAALHLVSTVTSILPSGSTLPTTFVLEQNYPNPFNPTTTITYKLHKPGDVRLDVFDVLGKKVTTLVSQPQDRGRHAVQLNAQELASGILFYRLSLDEKTVTRWMVLIR